MEGNIACGKTTLMQHFEKYSTVHPVPEPIEEWTNLDGHNALVNKYFFKMLINIVGIVQFL